MEELNFHRKGKYTVVLELVGSKTWFSLLWITAPDNHYTTHCSLLDTYVAQSTLVPTKENLLKQFSPTWPHWAELVIELPCACVCLCLCVCAIECSFFSRPLIGPQITLSDPGLSLVDPPHPLSLLNCIGPTIRIGREILCLPYAGFFSSN